MVELLELLSAYAGSLIYGSASKPRPPIYPAIARGVAFGGVLVAVWVLLYRPNVQHPLSFVSALWAFGAITVAVAEFELGSRWVGLLLAISLVGLVGLGLWGEMQ